MRNLLFQGSFSKAEKYRKYHGMLPMKGKKPPRML